MTLSRYARQTDLIHCDMTTPIMIVGAGGIGSFTVLTLGKMGFSDLRVYDFDSVEEHNLPNQFYRTQDLSQHKVTALEGILKEFASVEITPHVERITPEDIDIYRPMVLISAVDNMTTRKQLYDTWKEHPSIEFFLDGRMGADQIEVYTIKQTDEKAKAMYEARLWSEEETTPVPCTSRATMYNVLMIASIISNHTRLILQGEDVHPAVIVDNKNVGMHYIKTE